MVQSKAKSIEEYLSDLEPERRKVIECVRECIQENIQDGFLGAMSWGMIAYEIPLSRYPNTYNKKPLLYCSLAAQKRHYAIYLMSIYSGSKYLKMLESGYKAEGIKLDAGKCCIRFRNLQGVHLPTIGKVVAACSVDEFIKLHEKFHSDK